MLDYKQEAIKQWTNDPCGAVVAEAYEEGSKEFFEAVLKYRFEVFAPWLKELIDSMDVKGKTVLEIGCGMGSDLLCFARNGAKVIGLDLTPKHIELAKKLFNIYDLPAEFVIGDAEDMPFKTNSFDMAYSMGVLHHTPNINKAINEIYRVLKPNGKVIVGLYNKNSWHYWVNLIGIHGILLRKLFKMSIPEMLSSSVEYSKSGARSLVNLYTKSDCLRLFKDFSNINIRKYHWAREQLWMPLVSRLLYPCMPRFLPSYLGWFIVVSAQKL